MNYDDDYLITLFKDDPQAFFEVCILVSDLTGEYPPFGKYISISHNLLKGTQLPKSLLKEFAELKLKYGHVDSRVLSLSNKIDVSFFENTLKESFKDLINTLKQQENREDFEGLIAYCESVFNNINFRRKKGTDYINSLKYEYNRQKELYEWFRGFKKKVYNLSDELSIELKPNDFIHILVGHVSGYIVPRKGKALKFSSISSPIQLVDFIDQIVSFLKTEIIVHYSKGNDNFDRVNFTYKSGTYGIHIKHKRIITIYPVDESLLVE